MLQTVTGYSCTYCSALQRSALKLRAFSCLKDCVTGWVVSKYPDVSDAGSFGFMTPGMTATPASASFQQDTPGPEMQDTWQNAFNNVGNAVPQSTVSPHPARLATVMHPSETRDSHQHALFTESRFKNQHNASALARPLHVQQIPPQRLSCTIKFQHRSSVTASLVS